MNFTLHQLQILREVKNHQSITKAAQAMFMTQPALSIQLKKFQNQFTVPLIEYVGKQLYFTEFGEEIAAVAEKILDEVEQLKFKSKQYEGLLTGTLRISSASTGKYVIPYFLSGFIQDNPGIDLKLDVSNKTIVMQNLSDNQLDFALVSVIPERLDVNEEILLENKIFLTGAQKSFQEGLPLIYREAGSATRSAMTQIFKEDKRRKSIQLTSNEAVKQAVIAGLGYSMIPLIGIKNEIINEDLFIVPYPQLPITTHWRLIWQKKKQLSPVGVAFLEYIRTHKKDIIDENFKWYTDYIS